MKKVVILGGVINVEVVLEFLVGVEPADPDGDTVVHGVPSLLFSCVFLAVEVVLHENVCLLVVTETENVLPEGGESVLLVEP